MTPSARLAAAAHILDVLDLGRPVEPQLRAWGRANRYAGSKDRRAVADRVYACLRRRRSAALLGEDGRALVLGSLAVEDGLDPDGIAALCEGTYALRAPSLQERAILADPPSVPDWPDWLLPEAERAFGPARDEEIEALARRAPLDLRANALRTSREGAAAALAEEGIDADPMSLAPWALRCEAGAPAARGMAFAQGFVEPQDAGSQAVVSFAAPREGERVLDLCAGAGGKSLALAAATGNRATIHAWDAFPERLAPLRERAERAGARIDMPTQPEAGGYDLVLADAPCSGSGSWRRDPTGKWRLTPERLASLTEAQDGVIERALALVRPGGRVVYATCSVLPMENEDRIARFDASRTLRLHPARDGCDGFFAAWLDAP